jgi:hypothetical protein
MLFGGKVGGGGTVVDVPEPVQPALVIRAAAVKKEAALENNNFRMMKLLVIGFASNVTLRKYSGALDEVLAADVEPREPFSCELFLEQRVTMERS